MQGFQSHQIKKNLFHLCIHSSLTILALRLPWTVLLDLCGFLWLKEARLLGTIDLPQRHTPAPSPIPERAAYVDDLLERNRDAIAYILFSSKFLLLLSGCALFHT